MRGYSIVPTVDYGKVNGKVFVDGLCHEYIPAGRLGRGTFFATFHYAAEQLSEGKRIHA